MKERGRREESGERERKGVQYIVMGKEKIIIEKKKKKKKKT